MRRVYLDHNATTPVRPEVVQAMLPYFGERFGNPSSSHLFGREACEGLERARAEVAASIGANPADIVFTSGGSEADWLALKGTLRSSRQGDKHVITSSIEHHAVLDTCVDYLITGVADVTVVPVDGRGIVDPAAVRAAIKPNTVMISIMYANNETGCIQPIAEIGNIAREHGVVFHTDAVQCLGKIRVNVDALNADLVSVSSHKINGPKGVGALWIRPGTPWTCINIGGGQEKGRRPGTQNMPGIVGFGRACSLAVQNLESKASGLRLLRDRLLSGVENEIPGVRVNVQPGLSLPNTAHFSIPGLDSGDLLDRLDALGIAVSAGSACTAGSRAVSHVLAAMGLPDDLAHGSLRVSVGYGNTADDVDYFVQSLKMVVTEAGKG